MAVHIYTGDVGTYFIVTLNDNDGTASDISDLSSVSFVFENPNGTTYTKTGSLYTDGTDGKVAYRVTASDTGLFDVAGCWKLKITTHFPSSYQFTANPIRFNVREA